MRNRPYRTVLISMGCVVERLEDMEEAATRWVIALRDPGFTDWEAFTGWLEADPRHNAAYEIVAAADADAAATLTAAPAVVAPVVVPIGRPVLRRPPLSARRTWLGWSIAASLAVVAGVLGVQRFTPATPLTVIATAAGEHRSLFLPDGTRVDLNGGTRLAFDTATPREIRFDAGEALFSVGHDAAKPFTVTTANGVVQDVGTVFNLARTGDRTEIAVAEGSVMYNPAAEKLLVAAGSTLAVGSRAEYGHVDAKSVGSWRRGRLVYHGATVARIAADLSRNIGEPVTPSPEVARQSFSGVILLDRDRAQMFARLGGLLDVDATHGAAGWALTARRVSN